MPKLILISNRLPLTVDITKDNKVLPGSAYSIKVGYGSTKARYQMPGARDVRSLLKELASAI